MDNTKTKNKKRITAILIGILLIGAIAFGFQYITSSNQNEYEENINAITRIDKEERQKQVDQLVQEGEINIQYDLGATFNGKVSEHFNVKNIENNKDDIQFIIYDENGDEIYKSKLIKRGYEVNKIELEKELEKGTHKCKISIGYVNRGNVASTFPLDIEVK